VKVLVSGTHGLVGAAVCRELLDDGHLVVTLTRPAGGTAGMDPALRAEDSATRRGVVAWDPQDGRLALEDLEATGPFDAVVHLAGASIAGRRWSTAWRREIRGSRVGPTRLLTERLAQLGAPPPVLVCASAVGFYGSRGDEELTEVSSQGAGFLADVCAEWEAAGEPLRAAGTRVVHLRSGIVLAPHGGLLGRMLPVFRWGFGAPLGDGAQYVSWITLRDEVAVVRRALVDDALDGPINACAPNPVTNADFTGALAEALGRHVFPLAAPRGVLELALGREMAAELLFASQRALPARLATVGHTFADPRIEAGLVDLLAPR
jgi:uncharacterized protein